MLKILKTNISKSYWCKYMEGITRYQSAETPEYWEKHDQDLFHDLNKDDKHEVSWADISWFDNLFEEGGMKIPVESGKPLTLLISGPPGSGKTTLALELCLRIAINHGFWSLFISTESTTNRLIEKIKSFKIKNSKGKIIAYDKNYQVPKNTDKDENKEFGALTIFGQENITKWEKFSDIVELALEQISQWLLKDKTLFKRLFGRSSVSVGIGIPNVSPDILVFDSLNMVESEDRPDLFEKIVNKTKENTKLIIVVLDSGTKNSTHENWEFACDNIIRLDYNLIRLDSTSMRDYYIRRIEIIKSRFQGHIWGKQQMKIYPASNLPDVSSENYDNIMRRSHPYREEGGMFIYPSIHFLLSKYKKRGALLEINPIPTPCTGLNEIIGGFPEGRCTALIGVRGGHKSHLGFLHILSRVVESFKKGKKEEGGLIVSLRDDEQMTKQHLERILKENLIIEKINNQSINEISKEEIIEIENEANDLLNTLLKDNLLEILYFPPGYITPDEFFHRMFMSVFRFKNDKKRLTLLFNSLDQISARFPLCAQQPIFIPAMIQSLSGEKVTSIFIAVDEPGQPQTQYGLLPMADLILTFKRISVSEKDYYQHHNKSDEYNTRSQDSDKKSIHAVLLEVSRFSGGQQAGTKGLLELKYSDRKSDSLYKEPGLHLKKWEHDYFDKQLS